MGGVNGGKLGDGCFFRKKLLAALRVSGAIQRFSTEKIFPSGSRASKTSTPGAGD